MEQDKTIYKAGQMSIAESTLADTDEFAVTPAVDSADALPISDSTNLDPITGQPGFHPIGTGIGAAAGGMAAGAAAGTVVGPVGTVIGAAVGAIVGGLAGKGVAEKVDPTDSTDLEGDRPLV